MARGNPRPQVIPMDDAAGSLFVAWYNNHAGEMIAVTGDLGAFYSKIKGGCARLALILHATRVADGDLSVSPASIDVVSIRSAITLAEWFKHEARRVCAMLAEGEEAKVGRQNLELIARVGGFVSVRDWQRLKSHGTSAEAEGELNQLVVEGLGSWGVPKPDARGGRPTKLFRLAEGSDTDKTTLDNGG